MAAIKTEIQVLLIVGSLEMYKIYSCNLVYTDVLIHFNYSKHIL